jgi:hypothetical protein
MAYALAFLAFVLVLLPGLFYLAVRAGRALSDSTLTVRKAFIAFSYALVPLGLSAWIAFSLSFVFANLSYLWPALSDPLGWGWNLLGTASLAWTPYLMGLIPSLSGGLAGWAGLGRRTAYQITRKATRARQSPGAAVATFCY